MPVHKSTFFLLFFSLRFGSANVVVLRLENVDPAAVDLLLTCICVVRLHDDVRPVQRLCLTMATPWQPFSGSLGACAELSSSFSLQVRARAFCEVEERIVLSFGIFWSVFVTMAVIFSAGDSRKDVLVG